MFDAATLADFLHRCDSERLRVLGDLIEEQPEDPYARAALAEANRLFEIHARRSLVVRRVREYHTPGLVNYTIGQMMAIRSKMTHFIRQDGQTWLVDPAIAGPIVSLIADLAAWVGDDTPER